MAFADYIHNIKLYFILPIYYCLAFLRRNLARCPRDIKAQSYQAVVRPILEYASTHGTLTPNQTSYSWRPSKDVQLDSWQWTTEPPAAPLDQRRTNFKLVMAYRITYRLIDIPAPLYLHPSLLSTRGHTISIYLYLSLYLFTRHTPSYEYYVPGSPQHTLKVRI